MKKTGKLIFCALWIAAIVALGMYYFLAAPDDSVSEEENRNLAGMPALTMEAFMEGTFGDDVESYLLDHFPGRSNVITLVNAVKDKFSIATYEEYLKVMETQGDSLDSDSYMNDIGELLGDLDVQNGSEAGGDTGTGNAGVAGGSEGIDGTENSGATEDTGIGTDVAEGNTSDANVENSSTEYPPIEQKPTANISDYKDTLSIMADMDGKRVVLNSYNRDNVLALTAVLNKYASKLPENGKLMFTMVPQSYSANKYVNAQHKGKFFCEFTEVINAFGSDNVYAFDAADILSDAIRENEYVYFRTDMHWTPYGSYLVYREMAERAGKIPCDYDNDFTHTMETPFLGTYYRDNPTSYMKENADDLDLLMPLFPLEWRRMTAPDEYKLIDFLDFNAKKNDRYTVYLGGPAGPWTYAASDNGETENALVLTDSFGLGFVPFVTTNYAQVHYYDPRYYNENAVGYSVAEMIEKYEITDIYVVVGDLHSFNSDFIIKSANNQLE